MSEVSLVELVTLFREKVLVLFNGVLLGKSVLLLSETRTISDLSRVVYTLQLLVGPLNIQHNIRSYMNLLDHDQPIRPFYIGGVVNPIFKNKKCADILCLIDEGTVTYDAKLKKQLVYKQESEFMGELVRQVDKGVLGETQLQ